MHATKVAALAVLLLAATASARVLLQGTPPSLCDANTGEWDADSINCDLTCIGSGWEIDCEVHEDENNIRCKVDQDGAPDSADIIFRCPIPPAGQAPDCSGQLSGVQAANNSCVTDAVNQVLAAWRVTSNNDGGHRGGNTSGMGMMDDGDHP